MAFDSAERNTIYAVLNGGAVYQSSDEGDTWSFLAFVTSAAHKIVADPNSPGRLYMAALDGVFRSSDHGATWLRLPLGDGFEIIRDIIIDGSISPGVVWVAGQSPNGFGWVTGSPDGGDTWSGGLQGQNGVFVALSSGLGGTLYAEHSWLGLFKSNDHGHSWVSVSPTQTQYNDATNVQIVIDPISGSVYMNYRNAFIGGSDQLLRSDDGGNTWVQCPYNLFESEGARVQVNGITASRSGTIFVGTARPSF